MSCGAGAAAWAAAETAAAGAVEVSRAAARLAAAVSLGPACAVAATAAVVATAVVAVAGGMVIAAGAAATGTGAATAGAGGAAGRPAPQRCRLHFGQWGEGAVGKLLEIGIVHLGIAAGRYRAPEFQFERLTRNGRILRQVRRCAQRQRPQRQGTQCSHAQHQPANRPPPCTDTRHHDLSPLLTVRRANLRRAPNPLLHRTPQAATDHPAGRSCSTTSPGGLPILATLRLLSLSCRKLCAETLLNTVAEH